MEKDGGAAVGARATQASDAAIIFPATDTNSTRRPVRPAARAIPDTMLLLLQLLLLWPWRYERRPSRRAGSAVVESPVHGTTHSTRGWRKEET